MSELIEHSGNRKKQLSRSFPGNFLQDSSLPGILYSRHLAVSARTLASTMNFTFLLTHVLQSTITSHFYQMCPFLSPFPLSMLRPLQPHTCCFWKTHLTISLSELKFLYWANSWPNTKEAFLDFICTYPLLLLTLNFVLPNAVIISHQASVCAALLIVTPFFPASLCRKSHRLPLSFHDTLYSLLNIMTVPQQYDSTGYQKP